MRQLWLPVLTCLILLAAGIVRALDAQRDALARAEEPRRRHDAAGEPQPDQVSAFSAYFQSSTRTF